MHTQVIPLNREHTASLTAYLWERSPEYAQLDERPAVVILPGGGYPMCSDKEAEPIALGFVRAGFHAFVLRYTVKSQHPWPAPLKDYEQAMQTLLARAEEWGVDRERIAVCGFSAGGHLAACAATIAKHKPRAAVIAYGALTKETASLCGNVPLPVDLVDENTAPCFVFGTRNDNVAPVRNSVAFIDRLEQCGISFESHIYSFGPHGFGTGEKAYNRPPITRRAERWQEDCTEWLGEVWGERTFEGYAAPKFGRRINGDSEKTLSLTCTYPHILQQGDEAKAVLEEPLAAIGAFLENSPSEGVKKVVSKWTLVDILSALGYSEAALDALEGQLRTIDNMRESILKN